MPTRGIMGSYLISNALRNGFLLFYYCGLRMVFAEIKPDTLSNAKLHDACTTLTQGNTAAKEPTIPVDEVSGQVSTPGPVVT